MGLLRAGGSENTHRQGKRPQLDGIWRRVSTDVYSGITKMGISAHFDGSFHRAVASDKAVIFREFGAAGLRSERHRFSHCASLASYLFSQPTRTMSSVFEPKKNDQKAPIPICIFYSSSTHPKPILTHSGTPSPESLLGFCPPTSLLLFFFLHAALVFDLESLPRRRAQFCFLFIPLSFVL